MINLILRKLLSNRTIFRMAKNAYESQKALVGNTTSYEIPEITPFEFVSSEVNTKRINLLVPALSEKHVFGGIATALRFFNEIRTEFPLARIIVTDEVSVELKEGQFYSHWKTSDLSGEDCCEDSIVVAGNRCGASLKISENDFFVCTAWWTAYNSFKAIDWQTKVFSVKDRKLVYLIQDFEPGFYSWSSRYALADSTYLLPEKTIPVFNTKLLKDFFFKNGYEFKEHHFFEPRINPVLAAAIDKASVISKERKIIVYGRPGVDRNLFSIISMGLNIWSNTFENAPQWEIVSAGEEHADVQLARGVKIKSLGKLTLEQYIQQLTTSSIGISLMLSPHPSYPPLEMASFGIHVISNKYANKKISSKSTNIVEPKSITPENISKLLIDLCETYEQGRPVIYENDLFSDSAEFSFSHEIAQELLRN